MEKKKLNFKFGIIVLIIAVAALSRLLPHPPNVTPIGAIGLLGAAHFSKKYWAFIIPILALFFSNLLINNVIYGAYNDGFVLFGNLWVYAAFAGIVLLGFVALKKVTPANLFLTSLAASTIFFLVTNFGVWMSGVMYPMSFAGLMAAYTAGLPFFLNTIAGDLFFVAALFGIYELATSSKWSPVKG